MEVLPKDYSKYVILVNNTSITIEAKDKAEALEKFKINFERLFNYDFQIIRVLEEIKINDTIERY